MYLNIGNCLIKIKFGHSIILIIVWTLLKTLTLSRFPLILQSCRVTKIVLKLFILLEKNFIIVSDAVFERKNDKNGPSKVVDGQVEHNLAEYSKVKSDVANFRYIYNWDFVPRYCNSSFITD